jgi:hypothetical protein
MVVAETNVWHLVLAGVTLAVTITRTVRYATRGRSNIPEDEVVRSEQLQMQGRWTETSGATHWHRRRAGIVFGMKPEAFVRALTEGRWRDVVTEREDARIWETFKTAIDRGADGILIGFAFRGRPTRVVWADFAIHAEIVPPDDLPPNMPPGTQAYDLGFAGLSLLEHPDAEPSQLRPNRFRERPWFLTYYPGRVFGRVSWTKLL